jgi:molybdate transport system substrate-binding protein
VATLLVVICEVPQVRAGEVRVAVAANFGVAGSALARAFRDRTSHVVELALGSTGQLYAQILQGAPFDLFLAADRARPTKLLDLGIAVQQRTYAMGRLALFSSSRPVDASTLAQGGFSRLALANPRTAPYGSAAVDVLKSLQLYETSRAKLVYGQNVGQTYQFVATGNADIGFVARAQILDADSRQVWLVPQRHHQPLAQDAVLLRRAVSNQAAGEFFRFIGSSDARILIEQHGYQSGE